MRDLYFKKHDIKINNELDNNQKRIIAYNIASQISGSFSCLKMDYFDLFSCIYNTNMYKAEIPDNVPQVLYSYKNRSLFFSQKLNLNKINAEMLFEGIHRIQDDTMGTIGLCKVKSGKGLMLNEVANQYIVNKILKNQITYIESNGIRFNTFYENNNLLAADLIEEMALLVGDSELINGTLLANSSFEKHLKAYLGHNNFNEIRNNMDKILYLQKEIKNNEEDVDNKKAKIKDIYYKTQELIYNSYYNFKEIYDVEDAKNKLNLLAEKFKNTESYEKFAEFCSLKTKEIEKVEKDSKALVLFDKNVMKKMFAKLNVLNKLLNLNFGTSQDDVK